MTLEDVFDQYLIKKLNLKSTCIRKHEGSGTGCEICLVIDRHTSLAEELIKKVNILPEKSEDKPSTFLTGSYRRHTMVRPPKDIDFFIVLDRHEYTDGDLHELISPKKLLDRLEEVMGEIAQQEGLTVERQSHSVTLLYNDGFSIDVIPAFETDDSESYMIPDDEKNKYLTSNPKLHVELADELNNKSEQVSGKKRYKRLVRIMKAIKLQSFDEDPYKLRSFHLELVAADIFQDGNIPSYSRGLEKFLRLIPSYLETPGLPDPANKENFVDDYFLEKPTEEQRLILDSLKKFSDVASAALACEQENNLQGAVNTWGQLLPGFVETYKKFKEERVRSLENIASSYQSPPPKPWSY